ncbi:2-nonaprenyl-3-methyl-6-methoxy-1,4-benzoquinol hydroxylase [Thalassocella blandensis]|nr:2-nonaprenyl-3-methyl-6-methoxy-1,4-benzoquinol hydroxylase [Thalassocella blandensis]
MLAHEKKHFKTFDNLLKTRSIRSCYALWIWAFGGFVLGLFTALMGRNAIWVCTNAIETTVLHHLEWQLTFLGEHDREAYDAVYSIKADEESHQSMGELRGRATFIYKPIFIVVTGSTKVAIWLSTKL